MNFTGKLNHQSLKEFLDKYALPQRKVFAKNESENREKKEEVSKEEEPCTYWISLSYVLLN